MAEKESWWTSSAWDGRDEEGNQHQDQEGLVMKREISDTQSPTLQRVASNPSPLPALISPGPSRDPQRKHLLPRLTFQSEGGERDRALTVSSGLSALGVRQRSERNGRGMIPFLPTSALQQSCHSLASLGDVSCTDQMLTECLPLSPPEERVFDIKQLEMVVTKLKAQRFNYPPGTAKCSDGSTPQQFSVMSQQGKYTLYSTLDDFLGQNFDQLPEGPFWIDVLGPTKKTMTVFETVFGLHPLTSEDILTEFTRGKAELYDSYLFAVIEAQSNNTEPSEATNISLAVFKDFVLTFHLQPCRCLAILLTELAHPDTVLTPDWVLYLVLDEITEELEPMVLACDVEVGAINEFIFIHGSKDQSDVLRRIALAHKKLAKVTRKLKPKRDTLLFLTGGGKGQRKYIHSTALLYMRDTMDAVREMMMKLEAAREAINSAQGNYLSQINVQLGLSSSRGNDALNKLTMVSTIFLPLNLLAALFGMNVDVPFGRSHGLWAFGGIVLVMATIIISLIGWARRAKIL